MLMRRGANVARARTILQARLVPGHEALGPFNSAKKLFEKIYHAATEDREVPVFEAYARRHRRILASAVSKCTRLVLPDGPAGIIVAFYCPYGGH